jgi:hypothetical protein
MRITDPRRDINGLNDVLLTCEPVYEQEEIAKPANSKLLPTGPGYNVDINVQLGEKCVLMKIMNSTPPTTVEAQERIVMGCSVELDELTPISWTPGRVYKLRKAGTSPRASCSERMVQRGQHDNEIQLGPANIAEHPDVTNSLSAGRDDWVVESGEFPTRHGPEHPMPFTGLE